MDLFVHSSRHSSGTFGGSLFISGGGGGGGGGAVSSVPTLLTEVSLAQPTYVADTILFSMFIFVA